MVCDFFSDHRSAVGVVGLIEDSLNNVLIRQVVVLTIGGSIFEIRELKILGDDPGEGA